MSLTFGKTHVFLIGSGPGDPGLLTIKARQLIAQADVVVYDYLGCSFVRDIARGDAELIYVGKKGYSEHVTQDEINELLVTKAHELDAKQHERDGRAESLGYKPYPVIARVKGGDPFVFGRGGEEAIALKRAAVPFEVVPGVTSAIAASAYAGIPVTHRKVSSSVTLVTGNEDPTRNESSIDWAALGALVKAGDTVCFYMGMRNISLIMERLVRNGADPCTGVAVIEWGTTPRQRVVTSTIQGIEAAVMESGLSAPCIIVVGDVVELRHDVSWFEERPLSGMRILVTRTRDQSGALKKLLEDLGANVIEFPVIKICDPQDFGPVDRAIERLSEYSWLVFTSANGVRRFFDRLRCASTGPIDARRLAGVKVATIGPATQAELARYGIVADAVPKTYRAEAVFDAIFEEGLAPGDRVLIARAAVARDVLPNTLREFGCHVDVCPVYQTMVPDDATSAELLEALAQGVDAVTFTSSSTFENFIELLGDAAHEALLGVALYTIGPITSKTLVKHGFTTYREASTYTIEGLVECICTHKELREATL